jgi:diaminopimelate decarboxylase
MRTTDDTLTVRDGCLWFEDCRVEQLADQYGTPLFVLSEAKIRANARTYLTALARHWIGAEVNVLPSIKANYLLAVRRILSEEGLGCDTFGPGELWAAKQCGVTPSLVSVNGSVKSRELIRDAIEYGARITLDSAAEVPLVREEARKLGRRARVRVRIRPDYSALNEASDFDEDGATVYELATRYKPGVPTAELLALGPELLSAPELELTGLMGHIGRHRSDAEFWRKAIGAIVHLIGIVSREWGWTPKEVDIGGGFATTRDPTARLHERHAGRPPAPPIAEYCEMVAQATADALRAEAIDPAGITLEIEPGRSMFADTGLHLTRVRNVKREHTGELLRTWVETDTTEMFLTDGVMEHNRFTPIVCRAPDNPAVQTADMVGMSCQFDIIVPDAPLPEVAAGDVLALPDAGAYLEGSATNFNALPRPATVLVNGDRSEIIKRAETVADVFARDVVPARLIHPSPLVRA